MSMHFLHSKKLRKMSSRNSHSQIQLHGTLTATVKVQSEPPLKLD